MPRLRTFILLGVIAVLIYTGVIEVRFHTEKLASTPGQITGLVHNGSLLEQIRGSVIKIKRSGEQWLIKDEDRKLKLVILYVENDTKKLTEILDNHQGNPDKILPQMELLLASVKQLRDLEETVSDETLTWHKDELLKALAGANSVLERLKDIQKENQESQENFTEVTESLDKEIDTDQPSTSPKAEEPQEDSPE